MPRLTVKKYQLKELGKLIEYILFHRPDEFGLFLDDDDSLPIKELMWALHEETGWKHIRLGHLKDSFRCPASTTALLWGKTQGLPCDPETRTQARKSPLRAIGNHRRNSFAYR
jgi:hypothetical protein